MFYLSPEGARYYLGQNFEYGEFQYGGGAATEEKFEELGFTKVVIEPRPNDFFYFVEGPDDEGKFTATPRELDQLQLALVKEQLKNTQTILLSTDWVLLRANEMSRGVDVAVPAAVLSTRAEVRSVCDANCDLIMAAADVPALETLVNTPAEILEDPSDIASRAIPNPEPHLLPYPDLAEEVYLNRELLAPKISASPKTRRK